MSDKEDKKKEWQTPEGKDFAQKIKDAFFKQARAKEAIAEDEKKKKQQMERE